MSRAAPQMKAEEIQTIEAELRRESKAEKR
jgi:hypothetical protein